MSKNGKKEERSFRMLKKLFSHLCVQYREAERRLLLSNYDSRYYDVKQQRENDYQLITSVNIALSLCSEESGRFLYIKYVHPRDGYTNYEYMSPSSLYRLHRRAIYEIVDCLGI